MLILCWCTVCDAGPTLKQHRVNVLCLLGSKLTFRVSVFTLTPWVTASSAARLTIVGLHLSPSMTSSVTGTGCVAGHSPGASPQCISSQYFISTRESPSGGETRRTKSTSWSAVSLQSSRRRSSNLPQPDCSRNKDTHMLYNNPLGTCICRFLSITTLNYLV